MGMRNTRCLWSSESLAIPQRARRRRLWIGKKDINPLSLLSFLHPLHQYTQYLLNTNTITTTQITPTPNQPTINMYFFTSTPLSFISLLPFLSGSVLALDRAAAFTTWKVPACDINHTPGAVRTSHLINSDVCYGSSDRSLQVDYFANANCRRTSNIRYLPRSL